MFALQRDSALGTTTTTTTTAQETQEQAHVLQLIPYTTVEKLQKLLEEMKKNSEGFAAPKGEKTLELISSWETKFFTEYKLDSLDDSSRMRAVYALTFFFFKRVEFVMLQVTDNPKDKIQWFKFYSSLKELIAETLPINWHQGDVLPQEKAVDAFLRIYCLREAKKPFMQEINKAVNLFQEIQSKFFNQANEINQLLVDRFEFLKLELLEMWQENEKSTEDLSIRLNLLTAKVKGVFEEFNVAMLTMGNIENQLADQEEARLQQISDTESLINKM